MSNLRWRKNDSGGVTLQEWTPKKTTTYKGTVATYTSPEYWKPIADVYKAKRGNRYVVRVINPLSTGPRFDQYQAFTLREAMRLAKFIVGVKYGS